MVGRRRVASSLPPRLYEYRGKRRNTYYTITHQNTRINLGHDLLAAKRKLLEIEEGRSGTGTIGEMIDDYLTELKRLVAKGHRAPRTLSDRQVEACNLKAAFGKMPPTALEPQHVWAYLHNHRGVKAPVRANREISFLQAVFARAREQGIVPSNPCLGVTRNEEAPRERLVSDSELRNFCKMAWRRSDPGRRVALAAAIAYLTGKAQGQILRLHRNQLDSEGILFGKRKKGAATFVRWSRRLKRYVDAALAMPSSIESMYVVHNQTGAPYTSHGFKTFWQRLMKEWVAAGNERFNFHDLRAKAVTDVIERGGRASNLTGHRTERTPERVYFRTKVRKSNAVR
jgi:integrase